MRLAVLHDPRRQGWPDPRQSLQGSSVSLVDVDQPSTASRRSSTTNTVGSSTCAAGPRTASAASYFPSSCPLRGILAVVWDADLFSIPDWARQVQLL